MSAIEEIADETLLASLIEGHPIVGREFRERWNRLRTSLAAALEERDRLRESWKALNRLTAEQADASIALRNERDALRRALETRESWRALRRALETIAQGPWVEARTLARAALASAEEKGTMSAFDSARLSELADDARYDMPPVIRAALRSASARMREVEEENERLIVQLAGCLAASAGATADPATPDMWGWSPAYQAALEIRRERDALRRALEPFAQFAAELDEESEQLRNSYVVLRAPPGKALTLGQFRAASAALALWSMRAPSAPAGEGK